MFQLSLKNETKPYNLYKFKIIHQKQYVFCKVTYKQKDVCGTQYNDVLWGGKGDKI